MGTALTERGQLRRGTECAVVRSLAPGCLHRRTHKLSRPRLSVFSRARGALISIPPNFLGRDRERLHGSDRVTPTVSSESQNPALSFA
jgi:hypothetical protein